MATRAETLANIDLLQATALVENNKLQTSAATSERKAAAQALTDMLVDQLTASRAEAAAADNFEASWGNWFRFGVAPLLKSLSKRLVEDPIMIGCCRYTIGAQNFAVETAQGLCVSSPSSPPGATWRPGPCAVGPELSLLKNRAARAATRAETIANIDALQAAVVRENQRRQTSNAPAERKAAAQVLTDMLVDQLQAARAEAAIADNFEASWSNWFRFGVSRPLEALSRELATAQDPLGCCMYTIGEDNFARTMTEAMCKTDPGSPPGATWRPEPCSSLPPPPPVR